MSVFLLKCIAVVTMIVDHIGYVLFLTVPSPSFDTDLLRAIGRIAFPIYAFLLVNGLEKSSDRQAYLLRLTGFALLSQLPFSLAFSTQNYLPLSDFPNAAGFSASLVQLRLLPMALLALLLLLVVCRKQFTREMLTVPCALLLSFLTVQSSGLVLIGEHLNVFYSLAVYFACIWLLSVWIDQRRPTGRLLLMSAALLCIALCILSHSDYGYQGLILVLALYLLRRSRIAQVCAMFLWLYDMYAYSTIFLLFSALSCVCILFYRGKKGPPVRLLFYLIYPMHLILLFLIAKLCICT